MVCLRNRSAQRRRLWNHSIIDAGPTPNNVRQKAKGVGQFGPRSVIDAISSLDDFLRRGQLDDSLLPKLADVHEQSSEYWAGLSRPVNPRD